MTIEEMGLWLSALIKAEDESEGPLIPCETPFMTLMLPEDFDFYCEWFNSICDEIDQNRKLYRAKNNLECA